MIGLVICTHLNLADALLETAEMIVGDFPQAETVSVRPSDGMDAVLKRLRQSIANVDSGDGVIVMCDLFGGTPSNVSLSLLNDDVEVVTGVNLPMLMKLYTARDKPLAAVASTVCARGRENILVAGELLREKGGNR